MNQLDNDENFVGFNGNPRLKPVGVKTRFTMEQAMEFERCRTDPVYFIENYVNIISLDYGEVPFKLFDYQKDYVLTVTQNRFSIARWARQMGKSTTCGAVFIWMMIFFEKQLIAMMANKAETALEILYRIKEMYETVPLWLQQGVKTWNVKSISLENGSRIQASATTPSAIRGKAVNLLFIDEVAHIPKKLWDQFYLSSFSTITSGSTTKLIFVSTPKGLNHFYEFYIGAPENGFIVSDATWELHPRRDAEWKKATLSKMTTEQFAQEMECSFQGSSYSLIAPGTLTRLKKQEPIEIAETLWIFERPIEKQVYVITADVGEGLGLDHSAFHVLKINDIKSGVMEEVASFQDNRMDPITYATTIYRIASFYNMAYVLIESNDIGKQVVRYLKIDLEYPNLIRTRQEPDPARPSLDKTRDFGLRVNKRTRRLGCINFKMLLESGRFILKCGRTIEELKHFVRPPEVGEREGVFKAEDGFNDDLVMPFVNLSFIFGTKHFEQTFDTDSMLNMFKEASDSVADITKALAELHVPIVHNRASNPFMSLSNPFNPFSVRPKGISDMDQNERLWFSKN